MLTTSDILKDHAPEFVALDEALSKFEAEAQKDNRNDLKIMQLSKDVGALFAKGARPLIVAYAQALLKLAEREWRPIETAPRDGQTFLINSGPVPGNACCSNVEEPGCEIEWRYNTLRTQGWTNNLGSLATHWQPLPTPPGEVATLNANTDAGTEQKIAPEPAPLETQLKTLQEKLERAKEALREIAEVTHDPDLEDYARDCLDELEGDQRV